MTKGELIEFLEPFDDDTEIITHDEGRYSYQYRIDRAEYKMINMCDGVVVLIDRELYLPE